MKDRYILVKAKGGFYYTKDIYDNSIINWYINKSYAEYDFDLQWKGIF